MKNFITESELCPFCGEVVSGDPWNLKEHINDRHGGRKKDFIPYFDAIIRRWMRK